jgi:hypothetical protein
VQGTARYRQGVGTSAMGSATHHPFKQLACACPSVHPPGTRYFPLSLSLGCSPHHGWGGRGSTGGVGGRLGLINTPLKKLLQMALLPH